MTAARQRASPRAGGMCCRRRTRMSTPERPPPRHAAADGRRHEHRRQALAHAPGRDRADAHALHVRGQPHRARRADPARPDGAAQERPRIRRPRADPAVPAGVRVPVRVPHDRPGDRGRQPRLQREHRVGLRDRARPRRGGDLDHVPGDPGGCAADVHRVRLHPRDRGPRAGALPDLAGRDREGALRRGPGDAGGRDRVPDRRRHPRPRRARPPVGALVDRADADPARLAWR